MFLTVILGRERQVGSASRCGRTDTSGQKESRMRALRVFLHRKRRCSEKVSQQSGVFEQKTKQILTVL